jgi:hypothetical protein
LILAIWQSRARALLVAVNVRDYPEHEAYAAWLEDFDRTLGAGGVNRNLGVTC